MGYVKVGIASLNVCYLSRQSCRYTTWSLSNNLQLVKGNADYKKIYDFIPLSYAMCKVNLYFFLFLNYVTKPIIVGNKGYRNCFNSKLL